MIRPRFFGLAVAALSAVVFVPAAQAEVSLNAQLLFNASNGSTPIALSYSAVADHFGVLYENQRLRVFDMAGVELGDADLTQGDFGQLTQEPAFANAKLMDFQLFYSGFHPDTGKYGAIILGPVGPTEDAFYLSHESLPGGVEAITFPIADIEIGEINNATAHSLIALSDYRTTGDQAYDVEQFESWDEDNGVNLTGGFEVGLDSTGTRLLMAGPHGQSDEFYLDIVDLNAAGIGPAQAVTLSDENGRPLVLHNNQISEVRRRVEWEIVGNPIIDLQTIVIPEEQIGDVVTTYSVSGLPAGAQLLDLHRSFVFGALDPYDGVIFAIDQNANIYALSMQVVGDTDGDGDVDDADLGAAFAAYTGPGGQDAGRWRYGQRR